MSSESLSSSSSSPTSAEPPTAAIDTTTVPPSTDASTSASVSAPALEVDLPSAPQPARAKDERRATSVDMEWMQYAAGTGVSVVSSPSKPARKLSGAGHPDDPSVSQSVSTSPNTSHTKTRTTTSHSSNSTSSTGAVWEGHSRRLSEAELALLAGGDDGAGEGGGSSLAQTAQSYRKQLEQLSETSTQGQGRQGSQVLGDDAAPDRAHHGGREQV
ncbi:hypothetical protein PYCC9005_003362 [Savitreella phatthalungensis]